MTSSTGQNNASKAKFAELSVHAFPSALGIGAASAEYNDGKQESLSYVSRQHNMNIFFRFLTQDGTDSSHYSLLEWSS